MPAKKPKWRTWVDDLKDEQEKQRKAAEAEQRKLNPPPGGNPDWKPGRSGNPGGRPKGFAELAALCRANTENEVAILNRLISNPKTPASIKLQAIDMKWCRGWGRPSQTVTIEPKHLRAMTDDELNAILRQQQEAQRYTKQIELKADDVTIN
jgi:hypothetical protein